MILLATIGAKALYLLFLWLISAAAAAWLSDRKGYGERVGLTFGLILSVIGLVIVAPAPGTPRLQVAPGGLASPPPGAPPPACRGGRVISRRGR